MQFRPSVLLFCLLPFSGFSTAAEGGATGSIAGTVVAARDAHPIANATVTVYEFLGGFSVVGTATTDGLGHYQVDGLPSGVGLPVRVSGGDFWVNQAYGDIDCWPIGCLSLMGLVQTSAGMVTTGVDFHLNPAGVIEGTVRRADTNAPIAHANLSPQGQFWSGFTTDAAGHYHIGSMPIGPFALAATAQGFLQTFNDGQACDALVDCSSVSVAPFTVAAGIATAVNFELARGASIRGTVRGPAGTAVASFDPNFAVLLYDEDSTDRPFSGARIDLDGHYAFDNLIARHYSVRFGSPDDTAYVSEYYDNVPCPNDACDLGAVTHLAVGAGAFVDGIDATLASAQLITGTVRDAQTSAPLAGARVQAFVFYGTFIQWWMPFAESFTDASGHFTLYGVPSGGITVRASAAGHTGLQVPGTVCNQFNRFCDGIDGGNPWSPPLVLNPSATLDVGDLLLERGALVRGHVSNAATGRGLAGALIGGYLGDESSPIDDVFRIVSNADGDYESPPLSAGNVRMIASSDLQAQLFDHIACAGDITTCPLSSGATIAVVPPVVTANVDFSLSSADAMFSTGFDR